jgi:OHCU decarboxylase
MTLLPITTLNSLPADEFAKALRPFFEAATPLANALYSARPFASYSDLLSTAQALVVRLPHEERVEVVNAHPRIGARPETVSAHSYREQGYEREAQLDPVSLSRTYAELDDLNRAYEDRFGFRFVIFVNGRSKAEIVDVLRQRLAGSPEAELDRALSEMFQIARDRLRKL